MFYKNGVITEKYDLIVVGNNLAAVFSAAMAAKGGKSVAIVTESELLFSEFSETMIGYAEPESFLFSLLVNMGVEPIFMGDDFIIPPGMAAKSALKYLRDRGVNIYLKAAPIGLLKNGDIVCGIAVATKFGAFTIRGAAVADFTQRKYFNTKEKDENECIFSFQMGRVDTSLLNSAPNLVGDAYDISYKRDIHSENTCNVIFKAKVNKLGGATQRLIGISVELCSYLIKNTPAFSNAAMQKYALKPLFTYEEEVTVAPNFFHFDMGDIRQEEYFLTFENATGKTLSLLSFNNNLMPNTLSMTYGDFELDSLYDGQELDEYLGAKLLKINIPTSNIPTVNADLFIAGLGTGGTAAMQSAVKENCKIVAAEAMPTPGGTRTHGMVSAYWHGYRGGYANQNLENIADFAEKNLGKKVPPFISEAIYNLNISDGCETYYSTFVFDAVKKANNTVGALLATENGVLQVLATKSIDATGDGDLAYLSGAEYMPNGDPRDLVTQGYSIWGLEKAGTPFKDSIYKNDDDSISTERYSEYLRGIFLTQSGSSDFGFSPMLTVRESRRIKGKYILTMSDILRQKTFDDTLSVSLCFYDAHGLGTSPAYFTTVFDALKSKSCEEVCTRIPLRALLPEKDEGLMVISKAISATRDAGCLIRMNPDILNTGYAAGLIGANAAKNNISFEKAYTANIKNRLIDMGNLPDFYNKAPEFTAQKLLDGILSGDKKAIITATAYKEFLPQFEAEYKKDKRDKNLGVVLAALGSHTPFYDMVDWLKAVVAEYEENSTGATKIQTYAVLLSRLAAENEEKKEIFIPLLAKAIKVMDAGGEYIIPERGIYQNSKVSNRTVPNFKNIMGLLLAAETIPHKDLIEPLTQLSEKKNITLADGDEIHSVQMYLRIIAAAARCHDPKSIKKLSEYTNSERLFFREFAKKEIEAIGDSGKISPVLVESFWI